MNEKGKSAVRLKADKQLTPRRPRTSACLCPRPLRQDGGRKHAKDTREPAGSARLRIGLPGKSCARNKNNLFSLCPTLGHLFIASESSRAQLETGTARRSFAGSEVTDMPPVSGGQRFERVLRPGVRGHRRWCARGQGGPRGAGRGDGTRRGSLLVPHAAHVGKRRPRPGPPSRCSCPGGDVWEKKLPFTNGQVAKATVSPSAPALGALGHAEEETERQTVGGADQEGGTKAGSGPTPAAPTRPMAKSHEVAEQPSCGAGSGHALHTQVRHEQVRWLASLETHPAPRLQMLPGPPASGAPTPRWASACPGAPCLDSPSSSASEARTVAPPRDAATGHRGWGWGVTGTSRGQGTGTQRPCGK